MSVPEPGTFTFKRVGGWELRADVYRPDGDAVVPVVVWIHGGALIMGHRKGINPIHVEHFLDAGFAVVSIDYRLAPETLLPDFADDFRDAFTWVRTEGARIARLDPERIAVAGGSGGGYLTLLTGYLIEPRPLALVSFYGYGDVSAAWYGEPDLFYRATVPLVSEEAARAGVGGPPPADLVDLTDPRRGDFYLWCRQNGAWPREVVGFDPHTEGAALVPWCPAKNVTADYPPTFLLHGSADTDVPHGQSVQMAEALRAAGVEHTLVTIPGGAHGFDLTAPDDPIVRESLDQTIAFLSRHLDPSSDG